MKSLQKVLSKRNKYNPFLLDSKLTDIWNRWKILSDIPFSMTIKKDTCTVN